MKDWKQIFWSELELIIKDKSILLTCLIAPIFYAFFVGSIYEEKEVSDIPVAIVDLDRSSMTQKLSHVLDAHEKLMVKGKYANLKEALHQFDQLKVHAILVIPGDFEKSVLQLEGANVQLILNNSKFLLSNDINKVVQQVMLTMGAGVRLSVQILDQTPYEMALEQALPIRPEIRSIYNPTNNYGDYLLPILLILIIQQTLIIGFGQSSIHSLFHENILNADAMNGGKALWIFSIKGTYYFLLYSSFFALFYSIIFPYYHLEFLGNIWLHLISGALFIISILIFTTFLSTFFETMIGWTEIMAFSTYPIFLVSGYSWPLEAMPKGLSYFAQLLPSTPFFTAFRKLSIEGAQLNDIQSHLLHLCLLVLVGLVLLYYRFTQIIKKQQRGQDLKITQATT